MKTANKALTQKIIMALTGTMLMAGSAFAAEPEFQLDQITVTATRTPQTVASTPGDVTVITAEQIEQKGAKNLADALQGVAGVTVKKNGNAGGFSNVYINGSDMVVLLVDGKRMNIPSGFAYGYGPIDYSTYLTGDNIEKIEIIRGGASALYGADAVGGVINIITKKGADTERSVVKIEGGSNDTHAGAFTSEGKQGDIRWFLSANKNHTDGQRPNEDFDAKNLSLRLDKELTANDSLTLDYEHYGSRSGYPGLMADEDGNPWNGSYAPIWNTSSSLTDYGDVQRNNVGLTYTAKSENSDKTLRWYKNSHSYHGVEYGMDFSHSNDTQAIEYQQNTTVGKHTYIWGTEWRKEEVDSSNYDHAFDKNVKALYLQDSYAKNKYLSVVTGLRYDADSQFGNRLTPKMALNYQADSDTSYFMNWSQVFRAPTFNELYYNAGGMRGNPDLKAQTGWTAETGVKKKLSETSEFTASIYKRELNDAIDWLPSADESEWQAQNVKKLETTGANLAYAAKLSSVMTAEVGYSYMDSRDENGTKQAPYNNLHIKIAAQQGKFSSSLMGRYREAFRTVPSYTVWDMTTNYQLNNDQSVYLNVANVFDKQYVEVKGYPAQERSIFLGFKQTL